MKNYQLLSEHYLSIAQQKNNLYYANFIETFDGLFKKLLPKQQKALEQKLQLNSKGEFDESGFVQIACETLVCAYFAKNYPQNFQYEYKCNKPKDVDCQFTDGNYTYNIEVKCPGLANYRSNRQTSPKFEIVGRSEPEGRSITNRLMGIINGSLVKQSNEWQYELQKNSDNTLKSFLQEAHQKFPDIRLADVVNILVVCCDDVDDTQRWFNYLFQQKGLFTDDAFADPSTYSRVDIVLLANLLNRHHLFYKKDIEGNSWDFSDAFCLAFNNLYKEDTKGSAVLNFLYKFPHYSYHLQDYLDENLVDGINEKKYSASICYKKNLYLF